MHDYASLKSIIDTLRVFSDMDHKMQVGTILTLLEIAAKDAVKQETSPHELEKLVGLKSGTMTRNVYYWADGHFDNTGAYGFVAVRLPPEDRRQRRLSLTKAGREFIGKMLARGAVNNGTTTGEQVSG